MDWTIPQIPNVINWCFFQIHAFPDESQHSFSRKWHFRLRGGCFTASHAIVVENRLVTAQGHCSGESSSARQSWSREIRNAAFSKQVYRSYQVYHQSYFLREKEKQEHIFSIPSVFFYPSRTVRHIRHTRPTIRHPRATLTTHSSYITIQLPRLRDSSTISNPWWNTRRYRVSFGSDAFMYFIHTCIDTLRPSAVVGNLELYKNQTSTTRERCWKAF